MHNIIEQFPHCGANLLEFRENFTEDCEKIHAIISKEQTFLSEEISITQSEIDRSNSDLNKIFEIKVAIDEKNESRQAIIENYEKNGSKLELLNLLSEHMDMWDESEKLEFERFNEVIKNGFNFDLTGEETKLLELFKTTVQTFFD